MPEDIFENNPITLDLLREQFHNNDFTTMPVKDYSEYTEEELLEHKKITEMVNEQWDSISKELDIPYFQSCYSSDYPIEVLKERVVRIIADNVLRLLNDEKSLNNVWESTVAPLLAQGEAGDTQLHNTALALLRSFCLRGVVPRFGRPLHSILACRDTGYKNAFPSCTEQFLRRGF